MKIKAVDENGLRWVSHEISKIRDELSTKVSAQTFTATISTIWSGNGPYTQTVAVEGMTHDMSPVIDILLPDDADSAVAIIAAWEHVGRIKTGNNSITVTCYLNKPEVEIPIQIKVVF